MKKYYLLVALFLFTFSFSKAQSFRLYQLQKTWYEWKRDVNKNQNYSAIPAPFDKYLVFNFEEPERIYWDLKDVSKDTLKVYALGSKRDTIIAEYVIKGNKIILDYEEKNQTFSIVKLDYRELILGFGGKNDAEPDFKIYFHSKKPSYMNFPSEEEIEEVYEIDAVEAVEEAAEAEAVEETKKENPKEPIPIIEDDIEVEELVEKPNVEAEIPDDEKKFIIIEEQPEFPGGEKAMNQFIKDNLKYPNEDNENELRGTVYLNFVVEKDGSITNIKVLRSLGNGYDEEAIRIVNAMPKWKPGKHRGELTRAYFILPISFNFKK